MKLGVGRIAVCFAIFMSLIMGGCFKSKPLTIEYVFPDGFTGVAKIRSAQASGVVLVPTNGILILNFPVSGELEIRGDLPTLDWHRPVAHYKSGTPIPVVTPPNVVSDGEIALRSIGLKNNSEDWYLVGKESDVHDALTQKNGFEFSGDR